MRLRHLHLEGLTPYVKAAQIQEHLVRTFLAHKAQANEGPGPDPIIITAQFQPVYTCGRREVGSVTPEQRAYLTQETPWGRAEFREALRGGQTTFHGPGQLTAYSIMDLRRHGLSPRCFIHALEAAVMTTCKSLGVSTTRTANPGVWTDEQNKICAVGVHLRRHVSSHGIGLNVSTELGWFDRIIACGLEGKSTTSLSREGVKTSIQEVGQLFVRNVANELLKGIEEVVPLTEYELD